MKSISVIAFGIALLLCQCVIVKAGVIAPDAKVEKLADTFAFTEGPAADPKGNVYFTDQPNDKIYVWSTEGKLSVFLAGCERSNGTYFDADGLSLLACADLHNRIVSIDPNGKITVLVENYNGKKLNGPNDLWRDTKGGIYFTDPFYRRKYWDDPDMRQDCQCVYYLAPDRKTLTRVIIDLVQPNGIIGTADGKLLYVADIAAGKTYVYTINPDGSLANKKLFCPLGFDGMTIDNEGNVYLTGKGVTVFNSAGEKIEHIDINEPWTANVCFGGKDQDTLFITASKSLYAVKMRTRGVTWPSATEKISVIAPGAKVEKLADGFNFTEGPVADAQGDIYFTDIPNNRIHKWSDGKLTTFRENSGGANGLDIDDKGNLYVCEGRNRRITKIDTQGNVTVLADNYKGRKLNGTNDLWRDKKGGIYFTDPLYGPRTPDTELSGQYVFYLPADSTSSPQANSSELILVADDLSGPNGIVGTKDGSLLYVADYGGKRTWVYKIKDDGTLTDKKLFIPVGADGMELDEQGNLYLADLSGKGIAIVSPAGKKIDYINVPKPPSNICFGGKDGKTLFITARDSLYSIRMTVKGQ